MIDVDIYIIDNDEYYLMDELKINDNFYLYLSKVSDETEFLFRKREKDDVRVLVTIDDEKEVEMVSLGFANKILNKNKHFD